MRKFIFVALLSVLAPLAHAAEDCGGKLEAQFIGQAKNLISANDFRLYTITNLRHYQVNPLCPLDEQRALEAVVVIDAVLADGDEISGVLVLDPQTNNVTIE